MAKIRSLRFLFARRLVLGLVLLAWMPVSHAWLTTYHVGFLSGLSDQEVSDNDARSALDAAGFNSITPDFDGNSTIKKLYGGFFFTQNFGVQLEYIDLGSIDISADNLPNDEKEIQRFSDILEGVVPNFGSGVALSVIGRFPIWGNLVIQDWLGIFGWKNEFEIGQVNVSDDGIDLALGVSLEYLFSDNLSARIEWERFNHDREGVNILGAGMTLYFGG
jgi:hypothetical protein